VKVACWWGETIERRGPRLGGMTLCHVGLQLLGQSTGTPCQ
jgi:hypothetical protein